MVMLEEVLNRLWTASWQATLLAGVVFVVLGLTSVLRRPLPAKYSYLLWLLVIVRLALPVVPASSWSLYNHLPTLWSPTETDVARLDGTVVQDAVDTSAIPEEIAPGSVVESSLASTAPDSSMESSLVSTAERSVLTGAPEITPHVVAELQTVDQSSTAVRRWIVPGLAALWLLGVGLFLSFYLRVALRLSRYARNWIRIDEGPIRQVFDECCQVVGVRRNVNLYLSPNDLGPGSIGFFHSAVVIPESALDLFSNAQLRMVFLHELVHIRRFDPVVHLVTVLISGIHWFNPVGWLVLARLRRERETACDAQVLELLDREEAVPYGHTILKSVELYTPSPVLPGFVGVFGKSTYLRRRIAMIGTYRKPSRLTGWVGLLLLVVLASAGLTRATEPDDQNPSSRAQEGPTEPESGARSPASANDVELPDDAMHEQGTTRLPDLDALVRSHMNHWKAFDEAGLNVHFEAEWRTPDGKRIRKTKGEWSTLGEKERLVQLEFPSYSYKPRTPPYLGPRYIRPCIEDRLFDGKDAWRICVAPDRHNRTKVDLFEQMEDRHCDQYRVGRGYSRRVLHAPPLLRFFMTGGPIENLEGNMMLHEVDEIMLQKSTNEDGDTRWDLRFHAESDNGYAAWKGEHLLRFNPSKGFLVEAYIVDLVRIPRGTNRKELHLRSKRIVKQYVQHGNSLWLPSEVWHGKYEVKAGEEELQFSGPTVIRYDCPLEYGGVDDFPDFPENAICTESLDDAKTNRWHIVGESNAFVQTFESRGEAVKFIRAQPHYEIKLGNKSAFHGDFVVASTIQNSINKVDQADVNDQIKENLKELTGHVVELVKELDTDRAKQVARDLDTLSSEAISPEPRRKWYELSAGGLVEAANTVDRLATPIASTVKTVLDFLASSS